MSDDVCIEAQGAHAPSPPRSDPVHKEIARLLGKPTRIPTARPIGGNPSSGQVGRIARVDADGRMEVLLDAGQVQLARAAVSCVVRPQAGDLASLLVHGEIAWVIAILERDPAAPIALDFGASKVAMHARAISLQSDSELELSAHKLSSRATVSLVVCGDRYSNIEGTDSTRANCTLVNTAGHMSLHAGNTSITAESLIKVDAGQVHMC